MARNGRLVWAAVPELPAIQSWLRKFGGPWYAKRVERATVEVAELILSYSKTIVHIVSGDLEASLAKELRQGGLNALAVIGSPLAYASIEEARGSGKTWDQLTLQEASTLEHSYLAKAFMMTQEAQAKIWRHWLLMF